MNNCKPEKKDIYTIGEVSKKLQVDQHVVRFWTTQFSNYIKPIRKAGQRRYYSKEDIEMLKSIKGYLYDKAISIKGVHLILKNDLDVNNSSTKPNLNTCLKKLKDLQIKIRTIL